MMYIQSAALLFFTTALAAIVIALAGRALLRWPVWPIIFNFAARPVVVIFANNITGAPSGCACHIAKMPLPSFYLKRVNVNGRATFITVSCSAVPVRVIGTSHQNDLGLIVARFTAKVAASAIDLVLIAIKRLTACFAEHRNWWHDETPYRRIGDLFGVHRKPTEGVMHYITPMLLVNSERMYYTTLLAHQEAI